MDREVCNKCHWWLGIEEDEKFGETGECYRYPPTHADDNPNFAVKRPLTLSMDFCGEWVKRKD